MGHLAGCRPAAEDDLRGVRIDVDVPLGRRRRVARRSVGAAHEDVALVEARQLGLAKDRDREVRERAERHEGQLAGPAPSLVDQQVHGVAFGQRRRGRRQLRVAEAARPVRLGRRLEPADERHLATERDLDVAAAGQLEDRQGVGRDLSRVDVAGDAGHRDQFGVGRRGGVQEGERVVDPRVDVEDQRGAIRHAAVRRAAESLATGVISYGRTRTYLPERDDMIVEPRPVPAGHGPLAARNELAAELPSR